MSTEFDATIARALATMGDLDHSAGRTIRPAPISDEVPLEDATLVLGRTLGQGGMGIVRAATQQRLHREIAVKSLRPDVASSSARRRLLQEAWTTGMLEHPNVVPVHDIVQDDEGRVQVLLKRISGESWEARLAKQEHPGDELERHLEVLMQVAQAAHFAHRKGFVHRDIKPENVMLGAFGEVYLVDWGISVALEDDGTGRFPLASEAREVAGTPAYLAPEMLGGRAPRIGPATDVYLLGATLYEIVTGRAPHTAGSLPEIFRSVLSGPVPFEHSDGELWRICERAMDHDYEARFESAEQFRLAIEGYLDRRGARRLAERARAAVVDMHASLEDGDLAAANSAFREARFGYRAALEAWPEFEEAEAELKHATLTLAEAELGEGRWQTARALLSQDAIPATLLQALEEAEARSANELRQAERFRNETNEDTGRRTRAFVAFMAALIWIVGPLVRPYLRAAEGASLLPPVLTLGLVFALLYWARDSLSASRTNRSFATLLGVVSVSNVAVAIIGLCTDQDQLWHDLSAPLTWIPAALFASAVLSPRAILVVAALVGGTIAMHHFPAHRDLITSAVNVCVLAVGIWVNASLKVLRNAIEERRSSGTFRAD